MRVAILTNRSGETVLNRTDPNAQRQALATREAVRDAVVELGFDVRVLEVGPSFLVDLEETQPDVVFNLATGYRTRGDQANIAAALELSGIPFTGSSSRAHVLGLQKHLAKLVMRQSGIPTPEYLVVEDSSPFSDPDALSRLNVPVMVKPAAEGSSLGISSDSVTTRPGKIPALVRDLLTRYGPPVLVEEYIDGREFTVGLLGYPEPEALPVEEIVFRDGAILSYSVKSRDNITPVCPAEISESLSDEMKRMAKRAFKALGCRDFARVDFRLSKDERPFVLEINTLPGLMPDYSEFPRIAKAAGLSYQSMIAKILKGALRRLNEEEAR